jgi:cytochrome c oxidase subunit 2
VLGLWALITVLGVLFGIFVPARLMGPPASPTMHAVESTMTLFTIAAAPVAAVVWSVALYSLFAWRHRGVGVPETDGPALRTSKPTAVLWMLLSSLLCVLMLLGAGRDRVGARVGFHRQSDGGQRHGPAVGLELHLP